MNPNPAIPSINIWHVEDEQDARSTYSNLFNNITDMTCPKSFEQCEDLIDFLEYSKRNREPLILPDVLLLDIRLPGISGIDAISTLKALLPTSRIIMLTNYDDPDKIYDSFKAGASGYLLKGANIDQLLEAIRQAYKGGMLMPGPVANKVQRYFQESVSREESSLSARELEVLSCMAEGLTQKEIASQLFISKNTVNKHVQNIYQTLHVHCAAKAVVIAIRKNWIDI